MLFCAVVYLLHGSASDCERWKQRRHSVINAVLRWNATLLGAKDVKTNDVAVRCRIRYGGPGAGTSKFNQSR